MRVLIDPCAKQHQAAYASAVQARQHRQPGVLLTTIRGQNPAQTDVRFVAESEIAAEPDFPGPELIRQVLDGDRPRSVVAPEGSSDQRCEVLIEPLRSAPRLIIAGGGHVGQAVAQHALAVGFDVMVIDDRPEFASPERFADQVEIRCGTIADQLDRLPLGRDTYVVIVTRGHRDDAAALASCIGRPVAYLGMIGSRAKVRSIRDEFLRSGRATVEEFDRIYAPIGLDLGAVTVPEIAVSIVAQLIAVRRQGTAPRM
jgi:xanthine dehydrogenase accessory factor